MLHIFPFLILIFCYCRKFHEENDYYEENVINEAKYHDNSNEIMLEFSYSRTFTFTAEIDASCTPILRIKFFGDLNKDYAKNVTNNLQSRKKCGYVSKASHINFAKISSLISVLVILACFL